MIDYFVAHPDLRWSYILSIHFLVFLDRQSLSDNMQLPCLNMEMISLSVVESHVFTWCTLLYFIVLIFVIVQLFNVINHKSAVFPGIH